MTTLVPTVHERLAACGTRVYVNGLVLGADVQLRVGADTYSATAGGGGRSFTVNSLTTGDEAQARQDAGSGFTPWSPAVIVEEVMLPPDAPPIMPATVGTCSQCIKLDGLVPGCEVELLQAGNVVGSGIAPRQGHGCFGVKLRGQREEGGPALRARMIVCGQVGPEAVAPLVPEPTTLPKPIVGDPIFGCQTSVPLGNLHKGTRVRIESYMEGSLGSFCSCWTTVNVNVGRALAVGDRVRAQAYWASDSCSDSGPWGDWRDVIEPDERIRPELQEPLIEGDQTIHVTNQIEGAELMILIKPNATSAAVEFGPRLADEFPEIDLNAPLVAGNVVQVAQTLCGVTEYSNEVTVLPPPPVVVAPVVVPPLYECAAAVQVSNLHIGATVRIYLDGLPRGGPVWAGMNNSVKVLAAPALVANKEVTARQWVGGVVSDESAPPVPVQNRPEILQPIILPPVTIGDRHVLVSRVAPGARVIIHSDEAVLGETFAGEPVLRVPTLPITEVIQATVILCDQSAASDRFVPIKSPCAAGSYAYVGEQKLTLAQFSVPDTPDGEPFPHPIQGQLYYPAESDYSIAEDAVNVPLVVIAHGYWRQIDSYLGYDYLARHLARWGMIVFSLDMNQVNQKTTDINVPYQYARGEIILNAVEQLLSLPLIENRINAARIGLVGHSMGGEGVVMAQHINHDEGRGLGIRGVVSIAPVQYRSEIILRETKYMQIFGSVDILVSNLGPVSGPDARFAGVRIYDRAWRPKTHFWCYDIRHNPFNRQWVADGDLGESGTASLPAEVHERIAKCLINAFFQDALFNRSAYERYLQGVNLPPSLNGLEIFTQHSSDDGRRVLDNYGDLDEQEPLADVPLDRNDNSQGQMVLGSGGDLQQWQDLEIMDLVNTWHDAKGVQLAWDGNDALYNSAAVGLALSDQHWVSVRLAQFYENAMLNPVSVPVDLFVRISDGAQTAVVRLGSIATIPYPDAASTTLSVLRTVRLPLSAFQAANPALNIVNTQAVRLIMIGRATGDILADDLEFSL